MEEDSQLILPEDEDDPTMTSDTMTTENRLQDSYLPALSPPSLTDLPADDPPPPLEIVSALPLPPTEEVEWKSPTMPSLTIEPELPTTNTITTTTAPAKKGRRGKKLPVLEASQFAPFEKPGPLRLKDVKCPICLSIMIEPVSFPCKHSLCMECFNKHVNETSLYCPICRNRISVWCRKATKEKKLINTAFWQVIQDKFPDAVQARLRGEDSQDLFNGELEFESPVKFDREIANPGQILEEFNTLATHFNEELEVEKLKEFEATKLFLEKLKETEGPPIETQLEEDLKLAMQLQKEEDLAQKRTRGEVNELNGGECSSHPSPKPSSSTSAYSSSISAPPKNLIRSSSTSSSSKRKASASQSSKSKRPHLNGSRSATSSSTTNNGKQFSITSFFERTASSTPKRSDTPDSINNEFDKHFRPIACAPRTPPKTKGDNPILLQPVVLSSETARRSLLQEFEASTESPDKLNEPSILHQHYDSPHMFSWISLQGAEEDEKIGDTCEEEDDGEAGDYPGLPPGGISQPESLLVDSCDSASDASSQAFTDQVFLSQEIERQREKEAQEEMDRKIALRLQREWNKTTYVEPEYPFTRSTRPRRKPSFGSGSNSTTVKKTSSSSSTASSSSSGSSGSGPGSGKMLFGKNK